MSVPRSLRFPFLSVIVLSMFSSDLLAQPASQTGTVANAQAYFTEPALAPDRKEIAFVSGGDIWTVDAGGGTAALLVSNPANESRPVYSPDGKQLAFVSTRTGNGDIYVLNLTSGELRRVTFDDGLDQLDGWSRDGRWIYFGSNRTGRYEIWRVE